VGGGVPVHGGFGSGGAQCKPYMGSIHWRAESGGRRGGAAMSHLGEGGLLTSEIVAVGARHAEVEGHAA